MQGANVSQDGSAFSASASIRRSPIAFNSWAFRALLVSSLVLLFSAASPWKFETQNVDNQWGIYIVNRSVTRPVFDGLTKSLLPSPLHIAENLYKIVVSCGSPCDYTKFVDTRTGQIDGPFFLVKKFDTKTRLVFYVGSNGLLTSKVLFQPGSKRSYDLPNVSPVAVVWLAIGDITILNGGGIRISYLAGKDFTKRTIVFH